MLSYLRFKMLLQIAKMWNLYPDREEALPMISILK